MQVAAALLEAVEAFADPVSVGLRRRYRLELGPGKVRVASMVTGAEDRKRVTAPRGIITGWSADSRLNMVETMCSLDWGPVVAPGPHRRGWRPGMITLTLPGDWQAVAPTAAAFKLIMDRFWKRWERRWGKAECVWKLEFQRRGAPHVHIYCAVPPGREFQSWLSRTWFEVVGSGDPRHLAAGTGVDWRDGILASDPKRLAVYFLKRAAGHNLGASKEYQHRVPVEWEATGGAGRFWGVKGLKRASVQVQLHDREFVQLRRLLRKWAKSRGRPQRSLHGGIGQGGMVLANDAPNVLAQLSRAVSVQSAAGQPAE